MEDFLGLYIEIKKLSNLEFSSVIPSRGCLAQMVERLPYTQNVGGSIPSAPTTISVSVIL
jgi:hypothetical protein